MSEQTPATPAQAATPGTSAPGQSPASTTPAPASGAQGGSGATVTITAEELRTLQRDQARLQSFQKRAQFNNNRPSQTANFEGADPDIVETLRQTQEKLSEVERKALRAEVGAGVRDILSKPEYQALPESTKALILKNPSALSNADNVDEALLDIEDFVREESAKMKAPNSGQPAGTKPAHEIPPVINAAAPAPAGADELEDISKLSGPSRSRATIRNLVKKAKGGQ
jgi:hypothetical protein